MPKVTLGKAEAKPGQVIAKRPGCPKTGCLIVHGPTLGQK
jgi:hypothetical protein